MKAIVANVLFGSIFGCLGFSNSAFANPDGVERKAQPEIPTSPMISAKRLSKDKLPIVPQIIGVVDRIFTLNKQDNFDVDFDRDAKIIFDDDFDSQLNLQNNRGLSLEKLPYTHKKEKANLVLGFQNTFWPSENNQKYWGLTTVEQWGEKGNQKLNLPKLNYTNSAPILPAGTSALTMSGGGNKNLAESKNLAEFKDFRGGVTYHRGIADQVTMGVGFVYEDLLVGFTQLTYKSDLLPVQTTVSLLAKESGVDLHSHVRFQPTQNIVLNYYNDQEKQKFDANWGVIPGLTLTAKSNSKKKSFSTGIKVAVHSDFISLSANAALDNNNNLQWNLKSRVGRLNFAYGSEQQKNTSDLAFRLLDSQTFGIQCSAFIKYQTRAVKQDQEQFMNWGARLHSAQTVSKNKHKWTLDLGYGTGNHGQGLIVNSSVALKSDMFLNLSYQEISPTSDDTKVKLLLSSK